ncbi:MAG: DNA polymerase III subunit alpha [Chloroflexota bacterium]
MSKYVELHCHSCFSLLRGASTPEELVARAAHLGMHALALTDRHGLYGAVRFAVAAREAGIHPVQGAELVLRGGQHLVLLAEDRTGYANLCRLITRAQRAGEKGETQLEVEWLAGHTRGLIALTGGRGGWVPHLLLQGRPKRAEEALERLRALFGPHHLYVEIQHHLRRGDDPLLAALVDLARREDLPLVVTNEVYYARRGGHRLRDVLVAIDHNRPLQEVEGRLLPNSEYYLKAPEQMARLFARHPQALENTLRIAERCHVDLSFRSRALPPSPLDADRPPHVALARLCRRALPPRYPRNAEAAHRQLRHELAVIRETHLSTYFLLVWDIVRYARERGILVRGRGSAASSIVAYLLDITNVDPLAHDLLFERFLSAESRVMPDIDLDICSRRREEVIQYVYKRYGEAHVGMACNYVTYRARSAVRDVGKALGLPPDGLARLSGKLRGPGRPFAEILEEALTPHTGNVRWEAFGALCREIQGLPRHLSIHVGGMCITRTPLVELVPLEPATMPGRVVTQWDKDGLEDAGLIKLDLLSLRTLSVLDDALTLIDEGGQSPPDLDRLSLDDPAVYEALCTADTVGAFQVESRAQQQALVKMKPRCFADIAVEVALIRPGPLQGNMVRPFFRRRMGREPVRHLHPLLAPILEETLGVIVFQEQVIRVAMAMGGFSAGEADMLRRAMSRHRSQEAVDAFRGRFLRGAQAKGVPESVTEEVFDQLAGFASYGFCKSHAVAFAKTTYDTLYLRAHYPAAYYCAVLNNQPMGFYPPRVIVGDARRHGVKVRAVHVNASGIECRLEGEAIRLGFMYVDGLGEAGAEHIVEAREKRAYDDLEDFWRRTRLPRRAVENLILAGAMDHWQGDRRRLLWQLGRLRPQEDTLPLSVPCEDATLEPMGPDEALLREYGATGVAAGDHLMALFRSQVQERGAVTSRALWEIEPGSRVRVAGMVSARQAPPTAKGFVFLTLEDEWELMDVIVAPDLYQAQRSIWRDGIVLLVQGRLQRANGHVSIRAEKGWRVR